MMGEVAVAGATVVGAITAGVVEDGVGADMAGVIAAVGVGAGADGDGVSAGAGESASDGVGAAIGDPTLMAPIGTPLIGMTHGFGHRLVITRLLITT